MADRDMGLTVKITGDASGVITSNKELLESLSTIEAKLLSIAEASKSVGTAQTQTATISRAQSSEQKAQIQAYKEQMNDTTQFCIELFKLQKQAEIAAVTEAKEAEKALREQAKADAKAEAEAKKLIAKEESEFKKNALKEEKEAEKALREQAKADAKAEAEAKKLIAKEESESKIAVAREAHLGELKMLEEAATARANAFNANNAMQQEIVVEVTEAQQKILTEMRTRYAEGLASQRTVAEEEIGLEKTVDDAKLSMRLRLAEWDRQMNRTMLAEHQAMTAEWLEQFEAGTVGAMMVEKASQAANLTEVKQFIVETQGAFRSGAITTIEQIKALQDASINPEYSQRNQAIAAAAASKTIAENMRVYDNQLEMNRLTLDDYIKNVKEIINITDAESNQRILLEKKLQEAYRETAQIQFEANRSAVASGNMTREQQAGAILPFLSSPEYSRTVQADAAKELKAVDVASANEASVLEIEANRKRAHDDKLGRGEQMAAAKEAEKAAMNLAWQTMDIGYLLRGMGIEVGRSLGDMGYLIRDFGHMTVGTTVQLAGITAAFGAVAGSFELFQSALSEAGQHESDMAELSVAITNQGKSWDTASVSINEWAEAIGKATVFSKQEAVGALNDLTQKGIGYVDSQRIINVALDVASAKHQDLKKTVDELSSAEGLRASRLVTYDLGLKQIIQSHGTLQEMLDYLAKEYAGSASAAADTFQGKQKILQSSIKDVTEEIGIKLLPAASAMTDEFITIVDVIGKNSDAIGLWGSNFATAMATAGESIHEIAIVTSGFFDWLGKAINNFSADNAFGIPSLLGAMGVDQATQSSMGLPNPNAPKVKSSRDKDLDILDINSILSYVGVDDATQISMGIMSDPNALKGGTAGAATGPVGPPLPGPYGNNETLNYQAHMNQIRDKERQKKLEEIKNSIGHVLDHNSSIGNAKGGNAAPPGLDVDKISADDNKLIPVQEHLKNQLEQLRQSEFSLQTDIANATTSTQKQRLEMELHHKVAQDAKDAIEDIREANIHLQSKLDEITPSLHNQGNAYHSAVQAHNAFVSSLHGGKATTDEQKQSLSNLNATVMQTKTAYDATKQAVDALKHEKDSNTQKSDQYQKALNSEVAAQNALTQAFDDSIRKNKEKNADELATHGMTLEQEQHWYAERIANFDRYYSYLIKGTKEYNDALAFLINKANDDTTKITERNHDEEKRRSLKIQSLDDEAATYEMSIQEQSEYYRQRYFSEVAANGQYTDEAKRLWDEIATLEGQEYKKRLDEHKKLVDDITKEETGLLDNIITKHKSFRDDLKTILSDIEGNYIKSFEAMIVKGLAPMNNAWASALTGGGGKPTNFFDGLLTMGNGSIGKPDGTSANPVYVSVVGMGNGLSGGQGLSGFVADALGIGPMGTSGTGGHSHSVKTYFQNQETASASFGDASNYGLAGIFAGSAGAASLISQIPTDTGMFGALGGSTLSSLVQSGPLFGGVGSGTGIAGAMPSSFAGMFPTIAGPNTHNLASNLATFGKNMAIGDTVGGLINPGGNSTDMQAGSALGSIVGLLTKANPIAGAALAIGGALFGGLFGPKNDPKLSPDTSDPTYQKWIANQTGQTQDSHGMKTYANPEFDVTTGQQSQGALMTAWFANPANRAHLPAASQTAVNNLMKDMGNDIVDGLVPIASSIHNGMITLKSGVTVSIEQLKEDENTANNLMQQTGMSSSVYNLSRTYPSFTSSLSGPVGTYTPGTDGVSSSSGSGAASGGIPGSPRHVMQVNIDLSHTNLVGSVPNDVINQITTKLNDVQNGFIPGSYTTPLKYQKVGN